MEEKIESLGKTLEEVISALPEALRTNERILEFKNYLPTLEALFERKSPESGEIEDFRLRAFSKKRGIMPILHQSIGELTSPEAKRILGKSVALLEKELKDIFNHLEEKLKQKLSSKEAFDPTLPGAELTIGRLHPTRLTLRKIIRIFSSMGFDVFEGPEIEYEKYNFDLLNIPPYHPARDDVDTFFLAERIVLRTHTSPVQIRVMERIKAREDVIVQMISPGRAYRRDRPDATHTPVFHQVEGLQVGKGISMANMRWILNEFARRFFGEETRTRLRPDYFPFVEPGAELAVSCPFCQGKGCRVCKGSGWVEVLGCGMVHPQVLRNVDIDPEIYSGWAFGMGVERLAMLLYQIPDIRMFFQNDMRFLRQF